MFGGPNWLTTDRWNIEAKAEEVNIPTQTGPLDPNIPDVMSLRLQALLDDRFQLKLHKETRELPIYVLSVAKGGIKLRSVQPPTPRLPGQMPVNGRPLSGGIGIGPSNLVGSAITMTQFIAALAGLVGRQIVDDTSFAGYFDVTLSFAPESAPGNPLGPGLASVTPGATTIDAEGPSFFTAIQEQLGLKLDSSKGPVEVLVIDRVEKPTPN